MSGEKKKYEFAVDIVKDKRTFGGANYDRISDVLEYRSSNGWRLVAVTTNELGNNSMTGAGATIESTLLFFERELSETALYSGDTNSQTEVGNRITVSHSNLTEPFPFFPVALTASSQDRKISMTVKCPSKPVQALVADIILHDVLGDEFILEKCRFYNFSNMRGDIYVSAACTIQNEELVMDGITRADLRIYKCLMNEEIISFDSSEIHSIEQSLLREKNAYFEENEKKEWTFTDFKEAYQDTRQALDLFTMYQKADEEQRRAIEVEVISRLSSRK